MWVRRVCFAFIFLTFSLFLVSEYPIEAKSPVSTIKKEIVVPKKYASLVIDLSSGRILHNKDGFEIRRPASLTKMMTLYITFDAIKRGRLKMSQKLKVSRKAASMPRLNMELKPGDIITVREAILALIVRSANDVSVVLAESIAGSESRFVEMMNSKAKALGMNKTVFANPHGWHHEMQFTTAYDMAILGQALQINHPSYFSLFSKRSFTFKGRVINGHNRVLEKYKGANGLKTGYTSHSGYNIVTSTSRPEGKLIAVVLGGKSSGSRDAHIIELLNEAYMKLINEKNAKKSKEIYISNKKNNKPKDLTSKKSQLIPQQGEKIYYPPLKEQSSTVNVFDVLENGN